MVIEIRDCISKTYIVRKLVFGGNPPIERQNIMIPK